MAKLFASESAQEVAVEALRLARPTRAARRARTSSGYYRDTPLMIIGEGTNEIQRMIIARQPPRAPRRAAGRADVARGRARRAPADRPGRPPVRRQARGPRRAGATMRRGCYPPTLIARLAELGLLGAAGPRRVRWPRARPRTTAMIVEELARGSATLAALVAGHLAATHAIGSFGAAGRARAAPARADPRRAPGRRRLAPTRSTPRAAAAIGPERRGAARRPGRAGLRVLVRDADGRRPRCFLVDRATPGLARRRRRSHARLARARLADLALRALRLPRRRAGSAGASRARTPRPPLRPARLGAAAAAVGLAQAAFEAALRYCAAAHHLRQAHRAAPGRPAQARGHGDADHGGAPPDLSRRERLARRPTTCARPWPAARRRNGLSRSRWSRCGSTAATATRASSRSSATTATPRALLVPVDDERCGRLRLAVARAVLEGHPA